MIEDKYRNCANCRFYDENGECHKIPSISDDIVRVNGRIVGIVEFYPPEDFSCSLFEERR